ncbi:MAG TPA: glycosyltransferase family 4 protein, partial [Pyrinomonadaceae bacterium]|nr:glycosyltransferase family 4 protein [Pyrinomonadaceae bacterium]
LMEAGAMGLPIVSTDVGGVPDLMDHEQTALLVSDNDVDAVVRAVEQLLSDPNLAERLSKNGRRLAECSSWDRVKPKWEEIFSELMVSTPIN